MSKSHHKKIDWKAVAKREANFIRTGNYSIPKRKKNKPILMFGQGRN